MSSSPRRPIEANDEYPAQRGLELRRWRIAFIVVLVLLPCQLAFGRLVGETYPNVVLPSFGESPNVAGDKARQMRPRILLHEADGAVAELPLEVLFAELPAVERLETLKKTFVTYKDPPEPGRGASWQRRLLNTVRHHVPDFLQGRYTVPPVVTPETMDWLRGRIRELGLHGARAIDMQWVVVTYRRREDGSLAETLRVDVLKTRHFELDARDRP